MPSSFGQYQSGIDASTGNLVPAYSKMAELTANSVAGFGQSLAEGIQNYQKNSQENEMIDQEAQGLGMQLKQFHDMFGNNPEYAPFAEQLNQYIDKISKIPEMSLAQKRGALNGAKVAFSNIGSQLQMFNTMKTMNEERVAAEALNPKNNPVFEIKDKIVPMGLNNFDKSKSYLSNETEFINALNNLEEQGVSVDKPAKLEEYRKRVEESATELSKTNPVGLTIIDQVNAARKISNSKNLEEQIALSDVISKPAYTPSEQMVKTPTILQDNLNKYLTTTDSKGNIVPNESYGNLQKNLSGNPLNVQNKNRYLFEKKLEQDAKSLGIWDEEEKLKAQKLDNALEKGQFEAARVRPNENAYYQNILNKINEQKNSKQIELRKSLLEDKDVQSKIAEYAKGNFDEVGIPSKALELANKLGFDRKDYGFNSNAETISEALPLGIGAVVLPMQYGEIKEKIPPALVDFFSRIKEGKINKETATVDVGKPKISENQQQQISRSKPIWEQTQSELENSSVSEKINEPDKLSSEGLKLNPINVTTKEEVPISQEVRNQKAIDFMTQRLGYRDASGNLVTPSAVNKLFGSNEPTSRYTKEGDRIVEWKNPETGKIESHFVAAKEQKSGSEYVFGVQNPKTGELQYEKPVKSLDVSIRGKGEFATPNGAEKFKEILAKSAMVVNAMDKVKQIVKDNPLKTKIPWTDAQVEIVSHQSKAIASMKEILALDRLSDKDVQIILERIPNGTSWMRTPSQTKIQADNVINDVYALIKNLGDVYKLDVVTPSNSNSSLEKDAREAFISEQSSNK